MTHIFFRNKLNICTFKIHRNVAINKLIHPLNVNIYPFIIRLLKWYLTSLLWKKVQWPSLLGRAKKKLIKNLQYFLPYSATSNGSRALKRKAKDAWLLLSCFFLLANSSIIFCCVFGIFAGIEFNEKNL